MRAAVLCPGPSLNKFTGGKYDLIIAVNRAANYCKCDYLVALDTNTFGRMAWPDGSKPTIVCKRSVYSQLISQFPEYQHFGWLELQKDWLADEELRWHTKSLPSAMVLAWLKGANSIDCFGVDWRGTADFDGTTDVRNQRTAIRWRLEAELVCGVKNELINRGVAVHGLPDLKARAIA